jgi:hypothetical protein
MMEIIMTLNLPMTTAYYWKSRSNAFNTIGHFSQKPRNPEIEDGPVFYYFESYFSDQSVDHMTLTLSFPIPYKE